MVKYISPPAINTEDVTKFATNSSKTFLLSIAWDFWIPAVLLALMTVVLFVAIGFHLHHVWKMRSEKSPYGIQFKRKRQK